MNNIQLAIPFLMAILLIPAGMVLAQTTTDSNERLTVNEEHQETSTALYDLHFPDSDVSDEVKLQIIRNMLSSEPVPLPVPNNQQELGEKAVVLLKAINATTDQQVKTEKQNQYDVMTIPLLKAGIVDAEKFQQDPVVWKELLRAFTESDEEYKVQTVSHRVYDFNVGVKYLYRCYDGLLVCQSNWLYSNLNTGDLVSPPSATLPSYASYGYLEPVNKVKYIGQHPPQREQVDSWLSVKDGNRWVAGCHSDPTFTWTSNYQSNTFIVCSPLASGPDRTVYSSIGVGF